MPRIRGEEIILSRDGRETVPFVSAVSAPSSRWALQFAFQCGSLANLTMVLILGAWTWFMLIEIRSLHVVDAFGTNPLG